MAEVVLQHLTRQFAASAPAGLFDFSLHISSGELMAIVGPSGAGKSTLLRLIAGLERSDSGSIRIGGRDVTQQPPHARNIGLIAQRPAIYPHLSVRRNLSIGMEMWQGRHRESRVDAREIDRRVNEAIELLALGSILDRRSDQLSGGEAQRVALGRLLVRRPPVWLLDEPFSHVDPSRKNEFRQYLHLLRARLTTTMILVTHDPVEAMTLGQRLAVLESGRLRQVDSPAEIHARPADRFVAGFVGWPPLNLADGVLVRGAEPDQNLRFAAADGSFHLPVPAELVTHGAEGQPVAVGIRPEHLDLTAAAVPLTTSDRITIPGWRVVRSEFAPPRWLVHMELGQNQWRAWSDEPLETATLKLPLRNLHWFDGRSRKRM